MKNLEEIIAAYKEYTAKSYEEKLHAGGLLWEAGQALLNLEAPDWSFAIAKALAEQAEEMAYTKQYDLSPHIKEYTYLAHALAKQACQGKEDARLEPFAKAVAYYEAFKG